VVFWDHEWVGTDDEVRVLFSSSARMFQCLTAFAATDVNFMCHSGDEDPGLLPSKQALLADFFALDPAGAGGLGRKYWTSWGVAITG